MGKCHIDWFALFALEEKMALEMDGGIGQLDNGAQLSSSVKKRKN